MQRDRRPRGEEAPRPLQFAVRVSVEWVLRRTVGPFRRPCQGGPLGPIITVQGIISPPPFGQVPASPNRIAESGVDRRARVLRPVDTRRQACYCRGGRGPQQQTSRWPTTKIHSAALETISRKRRCTRVGAKWAKGSGEEGTTVA